MKISAFQKNQILFNGKNLKNIEKLKSAKNYNFPKLDDFFVDGSIRVIPKETEAKIIDYMDNMHQKILLEEFLAIKESKHIFLNA